MCECRLNSHASRPCQSGSAGGAASSRNLWFNTIHDARTLPPDVAPGHSAGNLVHPHGTVPAPSLLKIYPRSGPHEGGTNVTVHGYGQGRLYSFTPRCFEPYLVALHPSPPIESTYSAPVEP